MFKLAKGNAKCEHCPVNLISNDGRTFCFDPYTKIYLKLWDPVMISITAFSSVIALLIIFTGVFFMQLRETPIVKAANRPMTIVQLLGHFLLATIPPVMFLEKPTNWKCISKPIIVGLCFTATVSVNLAKTQKLHVIFHSSTRHSKKQKLVVRFLEWLVVRTSLLISISLLGLTFYNGIPKPKTIRNDAESIQELTCTNNNHIIIQLVYVLVLVLANGIQAVRARHLPSYFKETTHVIYSSFTSVLLLAALSAIYFTQKSAKTRDVIILASILTMNLLHFSLIYAYKIYIMLFQSQKNTRTSFQEKQKAIVDKKFRQSTESRD